MLSKRWCPLQWKDNAIRFDGALMAVPFVDYFEHTLDMAFLREKAYPFLKAQAEFYASYIVHNAHGTYDVPLACAQEGCGPRQMGWLGKFVQFNPTVDLAFAEWSMRTAARWAGMLGVDAAMQADFLAKAGRLAPYLLTEDPSFGNRTVWSEAKVQRWPGDPHPTTIVGDSTPFHANYMYPIVQFAPMHPTNLVNLESDPETLELARRTVWGQNFMSKWAPTNGLGCAWRGRRQPSWSTPPRRRARSLAPPRCSMRSSRRSTTRCSPTCGRRWMEAGSSRSARRRRSTTCCCSRSMASSDSSQDGSRVPRSSSTGSAPGAPFWSRQAEQQPAHFTV